MDAEIAILRGSYAAERASALAGVPKSTLHYWARNEILIPSISPERLRLWSWADLVCARAIYWMRHPDVTETRSQSVMAEVKKLFRYVREQAAGAGELLTKPETQLFVDRHGRVFLSHHPADMRRPLGAGASLPLDRSTVIDALTEFTVHGTARGPDLRVPRPHLRIVLEAGPHPANILRGMQL
jgi:hypothetical protein